MDLIRLFFLRYGFVSKLLIAVICPIFSEKVRFIFICILLHFIFFPVCAGCNYTCSKYADYKYSYNQNKNYALRHIINIPATDYGISKNAG